MSFRKSPPRILTSILCLPLCCVSAAMVTPATAQQATIYGHAQVTGEEFDQGGDNGLGFDRMRLGGRYSQGAFDSHLQVDFNAEPTRRRQTGTLLRAVQLIYGSWQTQAGPKITAGQFKTPLGMDFNRPGADLDITKRGLDAALVLNRAVGVMAGQRDLPFGLGYDVGVFGPAGRSAAVFGVDGDPFNQEGEDFTYVARLHWQPVAPLELEASAGRAEDAGGADASSDYEVFDLGAKFQQGPLTLRAEYIDGQQLRGTEGRDQDAWYAHAGWQVAERLELVSRHYEGESRTPLGSSELENTVYGVNLYLGPDAERRNLRVQINYLDASPGPGGWNGVGGFTSDAWLVQLQLFDSLNLLDYLAAR